MRKAKMKGTMQNREKWNLVVPIVFVLALVLVLAVVIIMAVRGNEKEVQAEETGMTDGPEGTEDLEKWQEGVISYNGKQYRYNTSIKTYLFLGIDNAGPVSRAEDGISGGQSDAMFLLVENEKDRALSVIAINRNSMTDVDVYNVNGDYVATEKLQICLQHGYGDGMRLSCIRSVDAVSRLFYQLPIDGYLSLRMDAVPIMNDAVGGVTVEVLQDLTSEGRNVSLQKGEVVTLNGDEAYVYLRARDVDEFNSATLRLERQMQYLISFFSQLKAYAGSDASAVLKIYDSIEDYMVSNIDFASLAEEMMEYGFDESRMYSVPGEMHMGELFEEYEVDDEALYEMILEIFYEPVET